jgi:tight adherence protein B
MAQWLLDLDPSTLNMIMAGAAILIMGAALVWFLLTRGEREMKDRIGRIAQRPRRGAGDRKGVSPELSLRKSESSMVQLEKIVNQILPNPAKMRMRLTRTGGKISLGVYVLLSVLIGGIGMLLARNIVGLNVGPALLIGLIVGLVVPHLAVAAMIGRRKKQFLAIFPDALDVLIRGLKAGLPATESIRIVGQEMTGPVAEEFLKISDSIRIGGEFDEVLWSAADRIDVPEFNFFVITLSIQRETGGNLGETLENLVDMLRKRRFVRLKVKALSSEAKASAIIVGSLPFALFGILYVLNREYISVLFTHPTGPYLIGIALAMLSTGIAVMVKLAKFEI